MGFTGKFEPYVSTRHQMSRCFCSNLTKTNSQADSGFSTSWVSKGLRVAVGRQAGGDLTAELCDPDNFCLLALLYAVCVRLECSMFWHRGVQYVGVLSNRAPPG